MPEMMVCASVHIYKSRDYTRSVGAGRGMEVGMYLLRFRVDVYAECGVFLLESVQGAGKVGRFVPFWSDGKGDDGFGNKHG